MEKKARHPVFYSFLLLFAAALWGFAFAAQRAGMAYVGPLVFNGIRFLLGAVVLLPLAFLHKRKPAFNLRKQFAGGLAAGLLCAAAAGLQQIGIVHTTAGKAGFITGLYVIFVPLLAFLRGHSLDWKVWPAGILAVAGLFLLSISWPFSFDPGDPVVLASSLLWAVHMLVINRLVGSIDAIVLSVMQFIVCGVVQLAAGLALEPFDPAGLSGALIPILYGGICSIGIGYTIQIVAQKHLKPSQVSIIICSEGLFAALGGFLVLGEVLAGGQLAGAGLMLAGMLVAQIPGKR